jgi:hypothetical protein
MNEWSKPGIRLDSQLANLVSAMATFETNYAAAHGGTAFDPTSVSSISDTTVLSEQRLALGRDTPPEVAEQAPYETCLPFACRIGCPHVSV